jgi:hypothetical protein
MTSTVETAEAPPALFDHLVRVYRAMRSGGSDVETADGDTMRVYRGHLTKLVTKQLGLAVPYYTEIVHALRDTGAAQQLKRGGGTSPSEWVLLREPTLEQFEDFKRNRDSGKRPQSKSKTQQALGMIGDVSTRVDTIEGCYDDVIEVVQEIYGMYEEQKIKVEALELRVEGLEEFRRDIYERRELSE